MSYRSWLKDVKSIHDLGDHCQNLTFRKPEDEKRDMRYEQKWLDRLRAEIPVAAEHKFAYGTRMHDSGVEWIRREGSDVRIRLDNDTAHEFAYNLAGLLGIDAPKAAYPVELVLRDASYVNAVRENREGRLRWDRWEDVGQGAEGSNDCLRYDWFFEQDGRIQWIAELIASRAPSRNLGGSLYLLVDCAEATAKDLTTSEIAKQFSVGAADIWSDFMNGIQQENGDSFYHNPQRFIEERTKARRMLVDDLRPRIS